MKEDEEIVPLYTITDPLYIFARILSSIIVAGGIALWLYYVGNKTGGAADVEQVQDVITFPGGNQVQLSKPNELIIDQNITETSETEIQNIKNDRAVIDKKGKGGKNRKQRAKKESQY